MPAISNDDETIRNLAKHVHGDLPSAIRTYVFSNMPARLLDLRDLDGIQIIDRSGVYACLSKEAENYDEEKVHKRILEVQDKSLLDRSKLSALIAEEIAGYAILSHRWLDIGEIAFNQMVGKSSLEVPDKKCGQHADGLKKLRKFCETAKQLKCDFAWADTCCIDKTSSSELDEAIRSMFRWYRNARVCIIYLAGTSSVDELEEDVWFTRGWTLQELLAPPRIKFYSKDWNPLSGKEDDNDKKNMEITHKIEKATTITEDELQNFQPGPFDIARRMGWAADRETTRIEDRAYSLIGIFDASLIIAYGEGDSAFGRLIKEIYNKRPHYEVFLWEGAPAPDYSTKGIPALPASYLPHEKRTEKKQNKGGYKNGGEDRKEDIEQGEKNGDENGEKKDNEKDDSDMKDMDGPFKEDHRQTKESAEAKVNYGDTGFALTNRGLRIKCLDVWVTLRCNPVKMGEEAGGDKVEAARGERDTAGGNEAKVEKWRVTLRPWHPLSRDIEDVEVLVDRQTCDKFVKEQDRYSKAIGVLDYLRNESDQPGYIEKTGRLLEGREHFGWLMMCPTGHSEGWYKVMTYNTVRLRFKKRWGFDPGRARTIERPLIQVHL